MILWFIFPSLILKMLVLDSIFCQGSVKSRVIDEAFSVYFHIVIDSQKEKDVRSSLKAEVERWASTSRLITSCSAAATPNKIVSSDFSGKSTRMTLWFWTLWITLKVNFNECASASYLFIDAFMFKTKIFCRLQIWTVLSHQARPDPPLSGECPWCFKLETIHTWATEVKKSCP